MKMKTTRDQEQLKKYIGDNPINKLILNDNFSLRFRLGLIFLKIKGIKVYRIN